MKYYLLFFIGICTSFLMPLHWHEAILEKSCEIGKYIGGTPVDCKILILELYNKK